MEFLSKNLEETAEIASNFASSLDGAHQGERATVIGLYGELGSGKTTFMKYLAESFGIKETIQSPTFVIMKFYEIVASSQHSVSRFKKIIHIDAYRIENNEEMLNLGWQEIIADPKNLICIEWPEKIAEIMPSHIMLKFEHVTETSRKISVNVLKMENNEKRFSEWINLKEFLHFKKNPPSFDEREIWWANIGENIGHEENGKDAKFVRPFVITKKFNKNLMFGVPCSSVHKENKYYHKVIIENSDFETVALLSQARTISSKRLVRFIGKIEDTSFDKLKTTLKKAVF